MICGSAKIRLDDKGRLALPSRFREHIQGLDGAYLTAHPHGCLALYSRAQFEEIVAQFEAAPKLPFFASHIEEVVVGCAEPLRLDTAGRVHLNPSLRTRARMERDVLLFVMNGRVRFWAEERWEQRHQVLEARLQDEGFSEELWRGVKI